LRAFPNGFRVAENLLVYHRFEMFLLLSSLLPFASARQNQAKTGLQLQIKARQQGRALGVAPPKRRGRAEKRGARLAVEGD